jgi:uncharacterized membrane protein
MTPDTLHALYDSKRAPAPFAPAPVSLTKTAAVTPTVETTRLAAIDWMRGLVMVLMAVDHSSKVFNAGRLVSDSFFTYRPGAPLPVLQFLTRFMTHLCAPTFVFLAGTGLAFTVRRQVARGESPWKIDRSIATRGIVIVAFELWISCFTQPPHTFMLQVLYAIGVGFLLMVVLRRLPNGVSLTLALGVIVSGEALVRLFVLGSDRSHTPAVLAFLLVGGERPPFIIAYPPIHWLAIMLLGWVWGSVVITKKPSTEWIVQKLAIGGAMALLVFALIRGVDGYGNMMLHRDDLSVVQWLHVSKYPPSMAYTTLELGIMALLLAALFQWLHWRAPRPGGLVVTLGQTPMFFYLLHFPLLVTAGRLAGLEHRLGLAAAYGGAIGVVAVLHPFCRWYRPFKATGRHPWTRYV